MPKYTKEFKIKLILEYLSGEIGGARKVADKYNIPKATLELWINQYKFGGFDNLSKKLKNDKFTSEFKLSVIQYRQTNNTSLRLQSISILLMDLWYIDGRKLIKSTVYLG